MTQLSLLDLLDIFIGIYRLRTTRNYSVNKTLMDDMEPITVLSNTDT